MRILGVKMENYGSFAGKHEVELSDRGLVLVLGDNQDEPGMNSNGAGKSTIFKALDWCLFGEVPSGDHVDSVISDGADKVAVEVFLEMDAGQILEVRRSRPRGASGKLTWVVDGVSNGRIDPKETQRHLERFLGLDREVFHAAVLFSQEAVWNFAEAKDAARMAMATKVFGLEELDDMAERAGAKLKKTDQLFQNLEVQKANLEGLIEALGQGANYQALIEDWQRQWDTRREAAQAEWEQCERAQETLQALEVEWQGWARESQKAYVSPDEAPYQAPIVEAQAAVAQWSQHVRDLQRQLVDLETRQKELQGLSGVVCRVCNQPVSADHARREVQALGAQESRLQAEYEVAKGSLRQWEAALGHNQQVLTQFRDWVARDRADYDRSQRAAHREIQELAARMGEYKAAAQRRDTAWRNLQTVTQEVNPVIAQQRAAQEQLSHYQQDLANLTQEHDRLQRERSIWEYWKKGLGYAGLKSYILDTRLNALTGATNQWLTMLTGGTCWVRLETQSKARTSGRLSNKITIRCFRWNPDGTTTERNYRSWSGGEKRRIAWALDFGLNQIIAARATHSYDQMILDEVFKHVDQAGGEAVVEMLRQLRGEKDSIFVVEHDSAFQSQFDTRLVVRKEGGQSQILEVTSEA